MKKCASLVHFGKNVSTFGSFNKLIFFFKNVKNPNKIKIKLLIQNMHL